MGEQTAGVTLFPAGKTSITAPRRFSEIAPAAQEKFSPVLDSPQRVPLASSPPAPLRFPERIAQIAARIPGHFAVPAFRESPAKPYQSGGIAAAMRSRSK